MWQDPDDNTIFEGATYVTIEYQEWMVDGKIVKESRLTIFPEALQSMDTSSPLKWKCVADVVEETPISLSFLVTFLEMGELLYKTN